MKKQALLSFGAWLVIACQSAAPTTSTTAASALMNEPEVTESIVSPSWITDDHESDGPIIQSVLEGGDPAEVSETMTGVLTESVPGTWIPYVYRATLAGNLLIHEEVSLQLDTADSLSVQWHYRWANSPSCQICIDNQEVWANGWHVWTETTPERGMVIFRSDHPELPLTVAVWFFPDPSQWPEALPESKPILWTTLAEAEEVTVAILDSIALTVPAPAE